MSSVITPQNTLPTKISCDIYKLTARVCKESFWQFVRNFWKEVPGSQPMVYNWHLEYLCNELQYIAELVFKGKPKQHDLVINIPPGTSKSSIGSILFPAWTWTRMPGARHIMASHTDSLVLDLATKSRHVIESELYQRCFPDIKLRGDQSAKSHFANTLGGDRVSCTVGGKTPMGFHGHFLCLPWESLITTEIGCIPIGEIVDKKLKVRVLGYDGLSWKFVWKPITHYGKLPGRELCRVWFDNGSFLEATNDHPVYVVGKGYINSEDLSEGDEVIYVASMQAMQDSSLQVPCSCSESKEWLDLLQSQMPCFVHEREETSSVQQNCCEMQELQQDISRLQRSKRNSSLLQQKMLWGTQQGGEQLPLETTPQNRVWFLQKGVTSHPLFCREDKVLFQGMCRQSACSENEREGELQLHRWFGRSGISSRVLGITSDHPKEREVLLLSVRKDSERKRQKIGCSSYRLEQTELYYGESCSLMPMVSYGTSRTKGQTTQGSKTFVQKVERSIRIPVAVYNIGVADTHNYFANGVLVHNSFDDPIDPQKVLSEAELDNAANFAHGVLFTRKIDKRVSVFFGIMQRLHPRDPAGILLEKSRTEGADKIKHICLPAEETDDISPLELRERYIDGLLDPNRLSRKQLSPYKADAYIYAGQFLQKPIPLGGGMFKEHWFNQRAKAAPRAAQRIRYWDRASSAEQGCFTAGVLMAKDNDGNYYVENVVRGQWEPTERNKRIRGVALRDRARYGPKYEPIIVVEAEGGSSGRDAWKSLVKVLEGFYVKEDRVTGSKDTRAEPWSTQLEAGNVWLVEDGTWDINEYIKEHSMFRPMPGKRLGKFKDQVDSSSGGFNILSGQKKSFGVKVYDIQPRKKKGLRIVVCSQEELFLANIKSHPCLLISLKDPSPREIKLQGRSDTLITIGTPPQEILPREEPKHSLETLLGSLTLEVPNLDPKDFQEKWEEEILPYQEKPEKLIMSREHGKKLWAFILAKRASSPEVLVFCDDGDGRALSLALGVCDTLRFARKSTIYLPGKPEDTLEGVLPPNEHIYQITKKTRNMIVA